VFRQDLYQDRGASNVFPAPSVTVVTLEDTSSNSRLKTDGQGYQEKTSFIWDDAHPTRKHLTLLKQ
jgi:hypothetical protein